MSKHNLNLSQASSLANAGKLSEALAICRKICKDDKNNPDVWMMLGTLHAQMGNTAEAVPCLRQAIILRPGFAEAHYNLGFVLWMQQNFEESLASMQQAVSVRPQYAAAWMIMGGIHRLLGRYDQAEFCSRQAIQLRPDFVDAHINLANTLVSTGRLEEAVESYRHAVSLAQAGRQEASISCELGTVLLFLGKPDEALAYGERALRNDPHSIGAITLMAKVADRKGEADKAYQLLYPLIESGVCDTNVALVFSEISKPLSRQNEAIRMMEWVLNVHTALSTNDRRHLHFQLGKQYDAMGEYHKAFVHYQQGNALKPLAFQPAHHRNEINAFIDIYSPEFMDRMPRASTRSDLPVFVVGMVRSGTTLVEQILASHPQVFGAGELPNITQLVVSLHEALGTTQQYPHCLPQLTPEKLNELGETYLNQLQSYSPDARRIVDKSLINFMHLGLIELLFPGARIIHCMRDPLDTCLSAYFQDFSQSHSYSYDLSNLGAFYKNYQRLMQHWRNVLKLPILEVQYEELIADQEAVSRQLVEFCGLDWDEGCLQFHKAKRYVATASYDQVRQSLYKRSAGRWKNYERYLEPLRKALQDN